MADARILGGVARAALDEHGHLGRVLRRVGGRLPGGLLRGGAFRQALAQIRASETWSADTCRAWTAARLQQLFGDLPAADGPPWPVWLARPPMATVTRDDLADDPAAYRDPRYRGTVRWVATGGTSGRPVRFLMDPAASAAEWAYITSMWAQYGYRHGDRRLVLRGLPPRGERPFSYDPLLNELRVSPFRLGERWWPEIEAAVRDFRPRFVHGYPSAAARLARLWPGPLPRVAALLLCSETVPPGLLDKLEAAWQAPALSWYGHSEKQVLGGACPGNRAYHMFPTYGLAEIVRGGRQATVGETGQLLATGFVSRALRLLRYETGDEGRFAGWGCAACGRQWPLIDPVVGRQHTPLLGRSGIPVTMAALNFHTDVLAGVHKLRYVQEEPGRVRLLIEAPGPSPQAAKAILGAHKQKVGDELDFELVVVDQIPLLPSGKHVLVDQRIAGAGDD